MEGGCSELGLSVPSISLEIIKVELSDQANLQLFLGQPRLEQQTDQSYLTTD